MNYRSIVQRTRAYLCLDCGKCTGSCPLARVDLEYSPRRIVERVVSGEAEAVMADPHLWSCMTCGLCSARCPSNVDFAQFIVDMRAEPSGRRTGHLCAQWYLAGGHAHSDAECSPGPHRWLATTCRYRNGEYFICGLPAIL